MFIKKEHNIRATEDILVIKRHSNKHSGKMHLLTIFDNRVFAKEMKMGDIQTNNSPLVSSPKIKDLCAQYLSGNYLERNNCIQGQIAIPELVPQAKANKISPLLPHRAFCPT